MNTKIWPLSYIHLAAVGDFLGVAANLFVELFMSIVFVKSNFFVLNSLMCFIDYFLLVNAEVFW